MITEPKANQTAKGDDGAPGLLKVELGVLSQFLFRHQPVNISMSSPIYNTSNNLF